MSKVVGLDLSITCVGVCRASGGASVIRTKAADGDRRLPIIRSGVMDAAFGADLVVMEEAPPGLKGAAIKAIHMVHGAVRTMLIDHGVPYVVVNPTTLKKFAAGPSADKPQMAVQAFKRAGAEFPGDRGGDMCDAWWLRVIGLYLLGEPPFPLPVVQVDTIASLVLPDACRPVSPAGKAAA